MKPSFCWLLLLLVAAPAAAEPGPDAVTRRGDFFYDTQGRNTGSVYRDFAPGFVRRGMSHKEKLALRGIALPDRPATLKPRWVRPKPDRIVAGGERFVETKLQVKFVEGVPVRLRGGALTAPRAEIAEVSSILAGYPEAVLRRLASVAEDVLDDNKDSGERISGQQLADMNNWYLIEFPAPSARAVALANRLLAHPLIEAVSFMPKASLPDDCVDDLPPTPDFEVNQNYLLPATEGVDAYYAWSYHPGGDGAGPNYWVADLELEWCFAHEDLPIIPDDVFNGSTGTPNALFMNHGTAVLGVFAACNNGIGATGISYDISPHMSDFDSELTLGANILTADHYLTAGEVMLLEVHIPGPVTGVPCPCNCNQYQLVAVEWDQPSFDAIQTSTANGVIVVEAAGNGATNLDDPAFNDAFDLDNRDSGAIIVGASTQGHAPSCSSNYGSRVDVHAYGASVWTLGYGGGSSDQTNCGQSYTNGFSGTSSAAPIVTGACASLQGIALMKYGYLLSPAQMRDRIKVGGSPQGGTKNIGPMPDLRDAINGIEPDVAPDVRAGWTSPIVGRTTNDATAASAVVAAAAFPGNASGPYWSWATQNNSSYSPTVSGPDTRLYIDDVMLADCPHSNFAPLEGKYCTNVDQVGVVKGGRHTLRSVADWSDAENESDDENNEYTRQFVWTPLALTEDVQQTRAYDPPAITTGYSFYNADGFSGPVANARMSAFAVMPVNTTDDFDARVHTEVPANNPLAGFGLNVGWSSDPIGFTDFVVIDGYEEPAGTYYGAALNFNGTGSKVVEWEQDQGTVVNPGVTGPFTLQSGDIMELHEISLSAAGGAYRITADVTSGSADIGLSLYPTTGADGFWAKHETEPGGYADNVSGFGDESIVVDPTTSGVYAIAVWKTGATERTATVTYNIVVHDAGVDLATLTPPGWYGPIVPRTTTDATTTSALLPASLTGNTATTSFNWSTWNWGPDNAPGAPGWTNRLYLDDVGIWVGNRGTDLAPGAFGQWLNTPLGAGQSTVRGGRHYLRSSSDADATVIEYDEANNQFVDWFVWSPLELANQTPVVRATPPNNDPQGYSFFAVDGFRSTPAPAGEPYWTAVGILPATATDDYDVRMHDASTGSKVGFGTAYAYSSDAAGLSDFSITNYRVASRASRDYGVINFTGSGDYTVQRADGYLAGTVVLGNGTTPTFGPFVIDAGDVLDFHEFYVPMSLNGVNMKLMLKSLSGMADLGLAIYDHATDFTIKLGSIVSSNTPGPGPYEQTGFFSLAGNHYYGLAVYKSGSADLQLQNQYALYFTSGGAVAVEEDSEPLEFSLAGYPNPFSRAATIHYSVAKQGGRIDLGVYGLDGRRVKTLVRSDARAGRNTATWDGRDEAGNPAAAGIYFLRLTTPDGVDLSRRITFLP